MSVYKGKQKSEVVTVHDYSRSVTTTSGRRRTTSEDIGWMLDYELGLRVQRLEFQFHSNHRRKRTDRSIGTQ